ncbi:MAG: hypothetical protein HZC17_06355 [Candidatus Omnitrophica bacterium]|nr:hypothetical protein [Candidatus Omnitrophota bacterium]
MKPLRFFFALVIAALLLIPAVYAAKPSIIVKASVNKAFMTVGDKVDYKIEIRHDPDVDILTTNPVTKLRDFDIKSTREITPTKEKGYIVEGKIFTITSYSVGEYVIDPITIRYKDVDGKEKEIKTNKLYVTVESIDKSRAPKRDIRDIKSITNLPSQLFKMILIAAGTLLGLLVILFVWLWFNHRDLLLRFFAPPLKPAEEAIQALHRLEDSGLLAKGHVQEYYFRMSNVIKKYFQKRYGFKALEDTSSEIIYEFQKRDLPLDQIQVADLFFEATDFVKFANIAPAPSEIQKDLKLAIQLVEKTKPIEAREEVSK